MNFLELETARKGKLGEELVKKHLARRGVYVYSPEKGLPHPCDNMGIKEEAAFFIEVKTYARQYRFTRTGIDIPDWNKYQRLQEINKRPLLLFFVDVFEGLIYVAPLARLIGHEEVRPTQRKVYFPLALFTPFEALTPEDLAELGPMERPERYEHVPRYFLP